MFRRKFSSVIGENFLPIEASMFIGVIAGLKLSHGLNYDCRLYSLYTRSISKVPLADI